VRLRHAALQPGIDRPDKNSVGGRIERVVAILTKSIATTHGRPGMGAKQANSGARTQDFAPMPRPMRLPHFDLPPSASQYEHILSNALTGHRVDSHLCETQ